MRRLYLLFPPFGCLFSVKLLKTKKSLYVGNYRYSYSYVCFFVFRCFLQDSRHKISVLKVFLFLFVFAVLLIQFNLLLTLSYHSWFSTIHWKCSMPISSDAKLIVSPKPGFVDTLQPVFELINHSCVVTNGVRDQCWFTGSCFSIFKFYT